MPRRRPSNDETNWKLRDNVSFYTDQAKAVPGAAKEVASMPRAWFGAVKEMVDDMRGHDRGPGEGGGDRRSR
jgi:hypothetical protein